MDWQNEMDWLDVIIIEATKAIADGYFHLQVYNSPPVWRERVYCYELYHQMRLRWPTGTPYVLTGELDKNGHSFFKDRNLRQAIPDFLVHEPGNMGNNFAIIEVKSQQAPCRGILKDICTLRSFRRNVGYQRAIHLVFGPDPHRFALKPRNDIELWHHAEVGSPAERIYLTPHEDHPNSPT
jgi:hypothetical protein